MKALRVCCLLLLAACTSNGQNIGNLKKEHEQGIPLNVCTAPGSCTPEPNKITIDANWRWTHANSGSNNCYTGNKWDATLCPNPDTCTSNCAIDGIDDNDFANTYGCSTAGGTLSCRFVTVGQYSTNVGFRSYMLNAAGNSYRMFQLLNKEFAFDVDVSTLECGLNGALYFVEMEADGGASKYPTNKGGARFGTGYCDAQCPHDVKWIAGKANSGDWVPSNNDVNSGKGHFGSCCAELDIWEANKYAQAFTTHPCQPSQYTPCEGLVCGDNPDHRYDGMCDKDGCDFASYRMGDKNFYGAGSNFQVDTSRPFTVVTQFITTDGTDNGDLKEMRRFYVQNGRRIQNSKANFNGLAAFDSITEEMCDATKTFFGDRNDHKAKGGLRQMSDAMRRGMVLVLSLWDDHDVNMLWLDSNYPPTADASKPGIARGPCPTDSGVPSQVEDKWRDAVVKFSNIKLGPIGSTTTV